MEAIGLNHADFRTLLDPRPAPLPIVTGNMDVVRVARQRNPLLFAANPLKTKRTPETYPTAQKRDDIERT